VSVLGIALLVLAAVLVFATGLPAFLVLLFAACVGAVAGIASGSVPVDLLGALPARIVNLLDNDLLQALPLYVLTGALLDRLPVADALFETAARGLGERRATPAYATLGLGTLLGPMNGSVGASVLALSRAAAPRLAAAGIPPPARHALIAVASTLGIIVPPSLVLILLGDAMMSAHTIAVNASQRSEQIVNTQDLFRGALVPGVMLLAAYALVAHFPPGRAPPRTPLRAPRAGARDLLIALACVCFVVALLAGVAAGRLYAVEGAAFGTFVLFVACAATGRLSGGALSELLRDAMATSGALFALLVAATTFTLVFRALGSDRLLYGWIVDAPLQANALVVVVLGVIAIAALALDAFEIIFVLVPVLMPPLLMRVADASWLAVLVLLALQASFTLPPIGYALLMTRGVLREHVSTRALARELAPFLFAQIAVLAAVLAVPRLVHLVPSTAEASSSPPRARLSDDEVARRLREMVPPLDDPPPDDAGR
jgi:tripartite ATP-independent transporter DctM subunit